MLRELIIRQFAIIQDIKIEFNEGLNILTGETGAGKSIIIDAIQLITGARGSVEYIRSNAEKAEIEALFDLPLQHKVYQLLAHLGIDFTEEGMLLLKREILKNGKSICRVNGQLVTLGMLRDIGQEIIQLHSQHQHQQLQLSNKQLDLLDAYGDKALLVKKNAYIAIYKQYEDLRKEVKHLTENEKEMAQRIDLLKYQINEIQKANLEPNEDKELLEQKNKIKYAEKITNGLKTTQVLFNEEKGIVHQLGQVLTTLEQIKDYDQQISEVFQQISDAYYTIEDASFQLNEQIDTIDFDEEQINMIEARLSLINDLKRKYGEDVQAIIEYADSIENELNLLLHRDEHLHDAQQKLDTISKEVVGTALELSELRKKAATSLAKSIEAELKDLQMPNTAFSVSITYEEDKEGIEIKGVNYHITPTGLDKANFMISPNPGEPLKPINKIASGGELSRIMLAIQTILANKDEITTIIFDEIDTGVSGRTAQAIAEKLALVAREKQVFAVTHLPQLASMADHHYLIKKNSEKDKTFTNIFYLDRDKRIEELARMLGGVEVTELTKKHAQEMIEKTLLIKNNI